MESDATIKAAVRVEIVAVAPLATVFDINPLGRQDGEWPGILRSEADQGRAHAWIITRKAIEVRRSLSQAKQLKPTYALLGFHWYDDRLGSEALFNAELDAVVQAVTSDAGVQVTTIDVGPFGAEHLHFAVCEFTKTVC